MAVDNRFFVLDEMDWNYKNTSNLEVLKKLRQIFTPNNGSDCVKHLYGVFILELRNYDSFEVREILRDKEIPFNSVYSMLVGGTTIDGE